MARSHASIHLRPDDKPTVSALPNVSSLALWLTDQGLGPTIMGSPAELLEVRRAIGRFLFPEQFEAPSELSAEDLRLAAELLDEPDAEDCERFVSRYGRALLRIAQACA